LNLKDILFGLGSFYFFHFAKVKVFFWVFEAQAVGMAGVQSHTALSKKFHLLFLFSLCHHILLSVPFEQKFGQISLFLFDTAGGDHSLLPHLNDL
jgi:hypothetical protein